MTQGVDKGLIPAIDPTQGVKNPRGFTMKLLWLALGTFFVGFFLSRGMSSAKGDKNIIGVITDTVTGFVNQVNPIGKSMSDWGLIHYDHNF